MSLLIEALERLHAERMARYTQGLVVEFPPIHKIEEPATLGAFSYTYLRSKVRLVYEPTAIHTAWGDCTPGEIARDYLTIAYPRKRRITGSQAEAINEHRSQPLYARPGRWGECCYVDIKSAYWSILNRVGWDVEYLPNKYLGVGRIPWDFPFAHNKLARNCLVSGVVKSKINLWTGEKLLLKPSYNPHLNMPLWILVQDILHGIASDMMGLKPYYINTDGYIVRDKDARLAIEIINSWGLPASIKHAGESEVWGVGIYRVGRHYSKHEGTRWRTPFNNVRVGDWSWLRSRLGYITNLT